MKQRPAHPVAMVMSDTGGKKGAGATVEGGHKSCPLCVQQCNHDRNTKCINNSI